MRELRGSDGRKGESTFLGRVNLGPRRAYRLVFWGSDPSSSLEFKYYLDRYPEGLHYKLS
jgi:hypothetical protein